MKNVDSNNVDKTWQHAANEWADAATNGLQYLKNVRDGLLSFESAISALTRNIEYARSEQPDGAHEIKSSGAERIAAERARQMESVRTTSHDVRAYGANYTSDLARAALAYLSFAAARPGLRECARIDGAPDPWPWDNTCWRPGPDDSKASRIRELEKAGALIAAEIDRLLEAKSQIPFHNSKQAKT